MKKILVFSDSHGDISGISLALKQHPDAVIALFLGDGISDFLRVTTDRQSLKRSFVRGNCDFYGVPAGTPTVQELYVEKMKILMTHGHLYGVKSGLEAALDSAAEAGADIFLFGHTHLPFDRTFQHGGRHIRLFNPGSISRGRGGQRTYGVIVIDGSAAVTSHGIL